MIPNKELEEFTNEMDRIFIKAVKEENEYKINLRKSSVYDINTRDELGNTALYYAILNHNLGLAKYLLESGADINTQNIEGEAPIILAARVHSPILHDLVRLGANLDIRDNIGRTALGNLLVCYPDLSFFDKIAIKLIIQGADVNTRSNLGNTPLILAAKREYLLTTKTLLELGADPTILNDDNEGPLTVSCSPEHYNLINTYIIFIKQSIGEDLSIEEQEFSQEHSCGYQSPSFISYSKNWSEKIAWKMKIKKQLTSNEKLFLESPFYNKDAARNYLENHIRVKEFIKQSISDVLSIEEQEFLQEYGYEYKSPSFVSYSKNWSEKIAWKMKIKKQLTSNEKLFLESPFYNKAAVREYLEEKHIKIKEKLEKRIILDSNERLFLKYEEIYNNLKITKYALAKNLPEEIMDYIFSFLPEEEQTMLQTFFIKWGFESFMTTYYRIHVGTKIRALKLEELDTSNFNSESLIKTYELITDHKSKIYFLESEEVSLGALIDKIESDYYITLLPASPESSTIKLTLDNGDASNTKKALDCNYDFAAGLALAKVINPALEYTSMLIREDALNITFLEYYQEKFPEIISNLFKVSLSYIVSLYNPMSKKHGLVETQIVNKISSDFIFNFVMFECDKIKMMFSYEYVEELLQSSVMPSGFMTVYNDMFGANDILEMHPLSAGIFMGSAPEVMNLFKDVIVGGIPNMLHPTESTVE